MTITQNHLDWLEEHFLFVRTWVLEHLQQRSHDDQQGLHAQLPIPGVDPLAPDIERFLLSYFQPISAWITHVESQRIAAETPVISFEDFFGLYDAQKNDN